MSHSPQDVAKKVQEACIEAARDGFRDTSMSGLCAEGAMEATISAIQSMDVYRFIKEFEQNEISN